MARTLTDPTVAKIKADPTKRVEISDALLPALRLIVQPSGAKSYAVRFRLDGRPSKFTIGTVEKFRLSEAREAARRVLIDAAQGRDPMAKKRAKRTEARATENVLENALEDFLRRHVAKLKSAPDVTRLLRVELAPWRGRLIQDIAKRDVVRLIDTVHDRGSPTTARRLLANLKRFFSWLVERDMLTTSPAVDVKPPSDEVQRDRILDDKELRVVLLAADRLGFPFGPMVKALAFTGARRDEVAGMRWSELRLEAPDPVWSLPSARTKNGRPHEVPLSPQVLDLIIAVPRMAGSDFVFSTTGRSAVSGFSKARRKIDRYIEEIAPEPLSAWRLHDLRRTFASGCARLGVQLPVVEKCLNHVSGSFAGVAGIYQRHDFRLEKRAAFEIWARHVEHIYGETAKSNVVQIGRAQR